MHSPPRGARYAALGRCLRHLACGACRPASPVSEYFGRTSPRPQPLSIHQAHLQQLDSGYLFARCSLRSLNASQTSTPTPACTPNDQTGSRGLARTYPLNDHSDVPIGTARSYKVLNFSTAAASVSSSLAKQNRNRCPAIGFSQNTETGIDATPMSRVHLLAIDASDSSLISL